MPVELTILSSWTSRPFCLKKPPSSAIHSGRLSAITLLYETLRDTGGPENAADGAAVAAAAGAGAVVAAGAAIAPVVGLATAACVGATAAGTDVGAAMGGAAVGGGAAAGWHPATNSPTPARREARRAPTVPPSTTAR